MKNTMTVAVGVSDLTEGARVRIFSGVKPSQAPRSRAPYETAIVVAVSSRRVRLASVDGHGEKFSVRPVAGGYWRETAGNGAGTSDDSAIVVEAIVDVWEAYKVAYLAALTDSSIAATDRQIRAWTEFAATEGKARALQKFWTWMRTLPRAQRSDCDPYGN